MPLLVHSWLLAVYPHDFKHSDIHEVITIFQMLKNTLINVPYYLYHARIIFILISQNKVDTQRNQQVWEQDLIMMRTRFNYVIIHSSTAFSVFFCMPVALNPFLKMLQDGMQLHFQVFKQCISFFFSFSSFNLIPSCLRRWILFRLGQSFYYLRQANKRKYRDDKGCCH